MVGSNDTQREQCGLMKMLTKILNQILIALIALIAVAATPFDAHAQTGRLGDEGSTTMIVCTELSQAEFRQMSEVLITNMLTSPAFIELTEFGDRPRMVLGDMDNDSPCISCEVDMMVNAFRNALVNSGAVRVMARGADADLILAAQLTGTLIRNGRDTDARFTLNITLTKLDGEYLGAWDEARAYRC